VAQAEFYFDCEGKWGDNQCNGMDNASYSMRWRARLRRVHRPDIGAELGRYLRDAINSGPVKNAIKEAILGGPNANVPPGSFEQSLQDDLFEQGFNSVRDQVLDPASISNGATGSVPSGMIH
jgi:hypothetical protein